MVDFKAKLAAKRAARERAVTTDKSVKESLHPTEPPQTAGDEPKTETASQTQEAAQSRAASSVRPNKALSASPSALLQMAKKAGQKPVTTSAADVAANARKAAEAAKSTETVKAPASTASKPAPKPSVQRNLPSTARPNAAAAMANKLSKATMSEEQVESITNLEDLDADTFMADMHMLEDYLTEDVPEIATLMQRVHRNLRQYPELTHILSDEQVGLVVQSFMRRKNIEIVTPSTGKGSANVKNLVGSMSKDQILDSL